MIPVANPVISNEEINSVIEVLKSGQYTSGRLVEKFEKEFAEYIGTRYAVACNSCTAALHMVYSVLGLDEYATFITTPMTFFSTISAGLMCRSYPTFVDVNWRCNIDSSLIENEINEDTSIIVPVHFYGHPCNMDEIMKISKKYNIPVVEDCAQAHGAEYNGRKVGSFGIAGCFSFFATKNMTTIEGGMVTTDNFEIYSKCKQLRSHGMTDRNTHLFLGYNYRMSEVNAAIGRAQLKKLDKLNEKRIANSIYLQENIRNPFIQIFYSDQNVKDVYFWQPVFTNKPMEFMKWLKDNKIGFRHRYWEPLYKQPIFKGRYKKLNLENAEKLSGKVFGLPNYPGLEKDELLKVVEIINDFRV